MSLASVWELLRAVECENHRRLRTCLSIFLIIPLFHLQWYRFPFQLPPSSTPLWTTRQRLSPCRLGTPVVRRNQHLRLRLPLGRILQIPVEMDNLLPLDKTETPQAGTSVFALESEWGSLSPFLTGSRTISDIPLILDGL